MDFETITVALNESHFANKIIAHDECNKSVKIRSNIRDVSDINKWIEEFSKRSRCSYIVRHTKNNSTKFNNR